MTGRRSGHMLENMITSTGLTKRYGTTTVVDDVSFTCPPGTVTGFLGPNGAGKSTTMRMLVGLSLPDAGGATVAGMPYRRLPNPGRVVGVMIDASAQHGGRTGRETLRVSVETMGVDRGRVEAVLDTVGLDAAAARRRVSTYSLGMRQRLGLAQALLGEPDVLVLDEPANGLDPDGIRWMRGLVRQFADRGGTVLLSSHLLGEVAAVADRLVVIASVASGTVRAAGETRVLLDGQNDLEDYYFGLTGPGTDASRTPSTSAWSPPRTGTTDTTTTTTSGDPR